MKTGSDEQVRHDVLAADSAGPVGAETARFWPLKRLRVLNQLTLEALAQKTGLTRSYLSKVERGVAVPSIAATMKLAAALNVEVGALVGESAGGVGHAMVRRTQRPPLRRGGVPQSGYEAIASLAVQGAIEVFVLHPPFHGKSNDARPPAAHAGEELLFVVAGEVEVELPHGKILLGVGDTLTFDSSQPHRCRSLGSELAEVLIVATRQIAS